MTAKDLLEKATEIAAASAGVLCYANILLPEGEPGCALVREVAALAGVPVREHTGRTAGPRIVACSVRPGGQASEVTIQGSYRQPAQVVCLAPPAAQRVTG